MDHKQKQPQFQRSAAQPYLMVPSTVCMAILPTGGQPNSILQCIEEMLLNQGNNQPAGPVAGTLDHAVLMVARGFFPISEGRVRDSRKQQSCGL